MQSTRAWHDRERAILRGTLVLLAMMLFAGGVAWAEPAITRLLPDASAAGSTIFVRGSGFGSDRGRIHVWFGALEGKVLTASDTAIAVNVPAGTPAKCEVTVQVGEQRSNSVPFSCSEEASDTRPRVRLEVGKNPLDVGAETTGTFTVSNYDRPVRIHFVNRNPDIVSFAGGNDQTVTTSGGRPNTYRFTIRGVGGPRLYQVDYDWSRDVVVRPPEKELDGKQDDYNVGNPEQKGCHCQGGRLLIVVGDDKDPTIRAAINWAYFHYAKDIHLTPAPKGGKASITLSPRLHVLRYPASGKGPDMQHPQVGEAVVKKFLTIDAHDNPVKYDAAVPGWSDGKKKSKDGQKDLLPPDCCYFDEVMIMFHGHQDGVYEGLIEYLPFVLNCRPVRKLTVWSCKSGLKFFPKQAASDPPGAYEKLLAVVKPKDCPCACSHHLCQARDADGKPAKCPTKDDATTALTAGYWIDPSDSNAVKRPVNLGINFDKEAKNLDPTQKPVSLDGTLTSPDGTIRQITISPDGTITASETAADPATGLGVDVFGGIHVGTDKNYPGPPKPPKKGTQPPDLLKRSSVDANITDPPYRGKPKACGSQTGCQPNPEGARDDNL